MKIYTKSGDNGTTIFVDGTRVLKSHPRIAAYGDVDELNSYIGVTRSLLLPEAAPWTTEFSTQLQSIQNYLFNVGSHLACESEEIKSKLPSLDLNYVNQLEKWIDQMQSKVQELKNFILPGGHPVAAHLHVCRTICRRAERSSVSIHQTHPIDISTLHTLNRLSDYFFVASRYVNKQFNINENNWDQHRATT